MHEAGGICFCPTELDICGLHEQNGVIWNLEFELSWRYTLMFGALPR